MYWTYNYESKNCLMLTAALNAGTPSFTARDTSKLRLAKVRNLNLFHLTSSNDGHSGGRDIPSTYHYNIVHEKTISSNYILSHNL